MSYLNHSGLSIIALLMTIGVLGGLAGLTSVLMTSQTDHQNLLRTRIAVQTHLGKIKSILGNSDYCQVALLPQTGSTLSISGASADIRIEHFSKVWLSNDTKILDANINNVRLVRTSPVSVMNYDGVDRNQAEYEIQFDIDTGSSSAGGILNLSEFDKIKLAILTNQTTHQLVECASSPEFLNQATVLTYSSEFSAYDGSGGSSTSANAPVTESWTACFLTKIKGNYPGGGGYSYTSCHVDKPASVWTLTTHEKQHPGMTCFSRCLK